LTSSLKKEINIKDKTPIWIALSEFYLDTELDQTDFKIIAKAIHKSPFSLEEAKQINKYEVFPVLQLNRLIITGEWGGFDKEWLVNRITTSLKRRNVFKRIIYLFYYWLFKWMNRRYWKSVEKEYDKMVADKI